MTINRVLYLIDILKLSPRGSSDGGINGVYPNHERRVCATGARDRKQDFDLLRSQGHLNFLFSDPATKKEDLFEISRIMPESE